MATSKQLQFLVDAAMAREVREGLSATPEAPSVETLLRRDRLRALRADHRTAGVLPHAHRARHLRRLCRRNPGAAGPSLTLVELGAGTATKTCILIEELLQRQSRALFYPIDVSPSALQRSGAPDGRAVPEVAGESRLSPTTPAACRRLRRISGRKLVLYIGSSIGNFEPPQAVGILRRIRRTLRSGDALLLGADFAKSPKILLPAYDDAQGVTAEFNKNILARLNRELDADFDLDASATLPLWNRRCSRMEIYLESTMAQTVFIAASTWMCTFGAGERIHTENSYKYTDEMIDSILRESGFTLERTWCDPKSWFGVHLARV